MRTLVISVNDVATIRGVTITNEVLIREYHNTTTRWPISVIMMRFCFGYSNTRLIWNYNWRFIIIAFGSPLPAFFLVCLPLLLFNIDPFQWGPNQQAAACQTRVLPTAPREMIYMYTCLHPWSEALVGLIYIHITSLIIRKCSARELCQLSHNIQYNFMLQVVQACYIPGVMFGVLIKSTMQLLWCRQIARNTVI